ncbi:MAG: hypothetical protein O7B35_14195 [Deltaproteobacteria bacterium]|nr:hypothetical protein [Deltaproteobacteria bacterium]
MTSKPSIEKAQEKDSQPILAAVCLASGAALVISIFTGASLALTLALLAAVAGVSVALKWSGTEAHARPLIKAQMITGIAAGIVGTAAYDLSRLLLVQLGGLAFSPFETFALFGHLIIGTSAPKTAALAVGSVYHFLNGIAFAVSYCFLLGGRDWKFGIVWALGLEVVMVTLYPGWLELDAVMKEFLSVSVLGHLAYGTTLGLFSQRRLGAKRLSFQSSATGRGNLPSSTKREK